MPSLLTPLRHANWLSEKNPRKEEGFRGVIKLMKKRISQPTNENATCIACMEREPEVVLFPCSHQILCGPCAHQWGEERKGCPMDRIAILEILPLERKRNEQGENKPAKRFKATQN